MVGKTTDVGTYICFDIVAPRIINRSFSDFNIYIWIIAHERTMRTPKGLVTDLLTTEIDKLINGNNCFGLGRVELKSWDKFRRLKIFMALHLFIEQLILIGNKFGNKRS